MIRDYLTQNESKTLEFKENAKNLSRIVKTVIAFAKGALREAIKKSRKHECLKN